MIERVKFSQLTKNGGLIIETLKLDLPLRDYSESLLAVTNVSGLAPVNASINITPYASGDGGIFNSSRRDSRNIVVTAKLMKDATHSMEDVRRSVYEACPIGGLVRVTIDYEEGQNYRQRYDGYVESIDSDYFGEQEGIQISVICPNPDPI